MASVLQTKMFDLAPTPTRRLIVPRGCECWWGVDPGTRRTALAFVEHRGPEPVYRCATTSYPTLSGGQRLDHVYRQTRAFVASVAEEWPPGIALVEQPSGKQENPALSYLVGVVQAAVYAGVQEALAVPLCVDTVTSSEWKKIACGAGNLYKPKRGEDRPYEVLEWAQRKGYPGTSWDEADALGIAVAARLTVELEQR